MKKKAEVEYGLLLSVIKDKFAPEPDFLEVFSYSSDSPWFKSHEFRMMLIEYRTEIYPKLLSRYQETNRLRRKHARAKRERERPKRAYRRKCE